MIIPIKNIYFLLLYAWNRLPESKIVDVSADQYENLPDLLARVFINGCNHILKSGLDKDYIERTESYKGVKGKIQFADTLKSNALTYGQTVCSFDEYSEDILQNQILKTTGRALSTIRILDKGLKAELKTIHWRLQNVSEIVLSKKAIDQVVIHRNNYFYHFLMHICRLIAENTVLDERRGEYIFRNFIQSDTQMRLLFEDFVRNFYKIHASGFSVTRENLKWQTDITSVGDPKYLPLMKTDISLENTERKLIIETKFTPKLLTPEHNKYRSEHMYQLYSYLQSTQKSKKWDESKTLSGLLLYPTATTNIDEQYSFEGVGFRVATVDLSQEWNRIMETLMGFIRPPTPAQYKV